VIAMQRKDLSTRRTFLVSTGTLAAGIGMPDVLLAQELPPTPACDDGSEPTARQTEGPFFRPSSPERADLREAGAGGRAVELTGVVLTRGCRPIPRALVDLWHADDRGEYDNRGFRYRGHQWTDAQGRFRFRTILPAIYPGRTRHYHVKVQGGGSRVLTTQLYFPDDPGNQRDGLFRRDLLMRTAQAGDALNARFDFVLDVR
jgi:protocatechuate 3,4-dioxygenase beta subunit